MINELQNFKVCFGATCITWSWQGLFRATSLSRLVILAVTWLRSDSRRRTVTSRWLDNDSSLSVDLATWLAWKKIIFVVLACHLPALDGLDWHFQASYHFTPSSAVNKSQSDIEKFRRIFWGNQTWGCWVRSKNASSVLFSNPPPFLRRS